MAASVVVGMPIGDALGSMGSGRHRAPKIAHSKRPVIAKDSLTLLAFSLALGLILDVVAARIARRPSRRTSRTRRA